MRARQLDTPTQKQGDGHRRTVIVDMDGTLADVRHRLHHLQGRRKNWKGFFASMHKDPPNSEIVDMVHRLAKDHEIIIVSGRPDNYQAVTEEWLRRYGIPYREIHMRPAGDHRPDHIVKREILERLLASGKQIELVIDDRPSVCDMWRECGLTVHQVHSDLWQQNS